MPYLFRVGGYSSVFSLCNSFAMYSFYLKARAGPAAKNTGMATFVVVVRDFIHPNHQRCPSGHVIWIHPMAVDAPSAHATPVRNKLHILTRHSSP
jgi:hypothetical protein